MRSNTSVPKFRYITKSSKLNTFEKKADGTYVRFTFAGFKGLNITHTFSIQTDINKNDAPLICSPGYPRDSVLRYGVFYLDDVPAVPCMYRAFG